MTLFQSGITDLTASGWKQLRQYKVRELYLDVDKTIAQLNRVQ
jgi:hypothetical protein